MTYHILYHVISINHDYMVLVVSPATKLNPKPFSLVSSRLLVVVPYPGEAPFDPRQGTGRVLGGIARQGLRRQRRRGETWFWSWCCPQKIMNPYICTYITVR